MLNFQHNSAVGAAIEECLTHQTATGCEMGIMFDASGKERFRVNGDASHIVWTADQLDACKGGLIVHNHPSDASLSAQDILCAGGFGLTILACTRDGSQYWATPEGFQGTGEELSKAGSMFAHVALGPADAIARSRCVRAQIRFNMDVIDANIAASHEYMLELDAQIPNAKINYGFQLSLKARAAIADWNMLNGCELTTCCTDKYITQAKHHATVD